MESSVPSAASRTPAMMTASDRPDSWTDLHRLLDELRELPEGLQTRVPAAYLVGDVLEALGLPASAIATLVGPEQRPVDAD